MALPFPAWYCPHFLMISSLRKKHTRKSPTEQYAVRRRVTANRHRKIDYPTQAANYAQNSPFDARNSTSFTLPGMPYQGMLAVDLLIVQNTSQRSIRHEVTRSQRNRKLGITFRTSGSCLPLYSPCLP